MSIAVVVDTVQQPPKIVARFVSVEDAEDWVTNHGDQEKVKRGEFSIDWPCDETT